MSQRAFGELNGGNLHIAFHPRTDDFDPLAAVVQTLKVQYEPRLATDFQGNGGRLIQFGLNPAILFVLATDLLQLLPHGGSVCSAVAGREGNSAPRRGAAVYFSVLKNPSTIK